MPDFFNPFSGTVPDRKLTNEELLRAIRLDIAGELEAIHGYLAHADATDNALAKAVLTDIANEERVHAGELIRLLAILTDEDDYLLKGKLEVDTLAAELASPAPEKSAAKESMTIGSLKNKEV
ncbi:MAG TPA: ferritin family protein [Methanoregula sp.]|nr:ferritin family protein [Methanoregula sp.]